MASDQQMDASSTAETVGAPMTNTSTDTRHPASQPTTKGTKIGGCTYLSIAAQLFEIFSSLLFISCLIEFLDKRYNSSGFLLGL